MALLSNQCLYVLIVWSGSIPGWHGAFIIENWELKIENGCVIIFICLLSLLKGGEIIQHLFIRQLVEKTHEFSLLFYFPGWHGAPAPCKNTRCSALTLHFSDAFAPCKEGSVWSGSFTHPRRNFYNWKLRVENWNFQLSIFNSQFRSLSLSKGQFSTFNYTNYTCNSPLQGYRRVAILK